MTLRSTVGLAALFVTGMAISAAACDGCGCTPKPAEEKEAVCKSACDKSAKKECADVTKKKHCKSACTESEKKHCKAKKACCPSKHAYKTVDTEGLKKMIASDEKVTIVDARSGKWDDGRRIGDAKQLGTDASAEAIAKALPDKDAKIVAYCTNKKCGASSKLAHKLIDLGYKNVIKYPAGVDGWEEAGNPVKKSN